MNGLPGYDAWKLASPADGFCEFCHVHELDYRAGWQPDCCTGHCGVRWRDPDAERDAKLDDRDND